MKFIDNHVSSFLDKDNTRKLEQKVKEFIKEGTPLGNNMKGWQDLDVDLDYIQNVADEINSRFDCILVIGIGGSYLGAKSSIEFLRPKYRDRIHFIGHNLDPEYLSDVFKKCKDKNIHVVVISKSGNTIEMKATLEAVIDFMSAMYGNNLRDRFTCVTGQTGYLRSFATKNEWKTLDVPENVGGRYSVFTNVGLLPIAISGCNIRDMLSGALSCKKNVSDLWFYQYSIIRNVLFLQGFKLELFCTFNIRLVYLVEWLKQLFGESEGKSSTGIFPGSLFFSTDLHSLGQYVQEGSNILFETFLICKKHVTDIRIDNIENSEKFSSFNSINSSICDSILDAHNAGNTPVNLIEIDEFSEYELGFLMFWFMNSCWMSANILGVDPSTQPGVQVYKSLLN